MAYFGLDMSVAGVDDDGSLQGNLLLGLSHGKLTVLLILAMEIPA